MMEVDVALSGGGIRSASIACGVLKALTKNNIVIINMSCVSGGGYTGSAFLNEMRHSQITQKEAMKNVSVRMRKNVAYLFGTDFKQRVFSGCFLCALIFFAVILIAAGILPIILVPLPVLEAIITVTMTEEIKQQNTDFQIN
jgi:hypothetical protein